MLPQYNTNPWVPPSTGGYSYQPYTSTSADTQQARTSFRGLGGSSSSPTATSPPIGGGGGGGGAAPGSTSAGMDLQNVMRLTKRRLYKRYQNQLRTWRLENGNWVKITAIVCSVFFVLYVIYLLYFAWAYTTLASDDFDIPTIRHPIEVTEKPPSVVSTPSFDNVVTPSNSERQEAVVQAFRHAWNGYKRYAFGHDEIRPVTNETNDSWNGWGVTLVDAMDTMLLMGLNEEFSEAREHVASLTFVKDYTVSFFETIIRYLGGFLGVYTLTNDELFLEKSKELADLLLPAFNSPSGLPYHKVNLLTGVASNPSYISCSVLSEVGSVQLELKTLSSLLKQEIYGDKAHHVMEILDDAPKKYPGLYPTFVDPATGKFSCNNLENISFGALGDSFYEYLLKQYLLTGEKELRRMYEESVEGLKEKLIMEVNGWTFISEMSGTRTVYVMDHLTCFVPGMLALGAVELDRPGDLELAKKLMNTCYQLYAEMPTHIGPETIEILANSKPGDVPYHIKSGAYLLRPETLESLFVLYRITGDEIYRDYAWNIFMGIENHCKTYSSYSGLKDVRKIPAEFNNSMQSFFLAETLKYLYLIFGSNDMLPLSEYVFNTEAHPFKRGISY